MNANDYPFYVIFQRTKRSYEIKKARKKKGEQSREESRLAATEAAEFNQQGWPGWGLDKSTRLLDLILPISFLKQTFSGSSKQD